MSLASGEPIVTDSVSIRLPATRDCLVRLGAGQIVQLSGECRSASPEACARILADDSDVDLAGSAVACGLVESLGTAEPQFCPSRVQEIGEYLLRLSELGVVAVLGEGPPDEAVVDACSRQEIVFFALISGTLALTGQHSAVRGAAAYEDLGARAMYRMELDNLPALVAVDSRGRNLYAAGPARYRREVQ